MNDQNDNQQIDQCVALLKNLLGSDLIGMYLYGSSVIGGLQRYSDIDLFVVSKRPTTLQEKVILEKGLLSISGVYRSTEKRPVEMMIVVLSDIQPWQYPPRFDFQYGDWLRAKFENGVIEPWETKAKPDLALVITQVLLTGKTLFGEAPEKLLPQVPYADFMTALTDELTAVRGDLDWDTRNVLLTLARMWCTVTTDTIQSKQRAAELAIAALPEEYKPVMERALTVLLGDQEETWADVQPIVPKCADYIVIKIEEQMKVVLARDNSQKKISVVM